MVIAAVSQQTLVIPFLYGPIIPHRNLFVVGLWWASGATLPWCQLTFTPNYGVMVSHWIFSFLLQLITLNENNFWRWLSEVVPVGWHIDFVFSSYGWYVKAKFVIFGCFLPHLTIDFFYKDLYNRFLLLKNYRCWHWIRSFVWFIPTNLESLIFD